MVPTLKDMPLLADFVSEVEHKKPLRGVTAFFIQHQLGNQGPQVEALVRLGLEPKRIFWLDIPYTSSERFRLNLIDRVGIPEENLWVNRYRVLEPYSTYQLRRTQELFRHLLSRRPERLLVLDDGAYFLAAAVGFRKQQQNMSVVEQTTHGLIKMEENASLQRYAAKIPIVNVARSKPKLNLESPWIGIAVQAALRFHLHSLANKYPEFALDEKSPCLVLGYGAIGRSVAWYLQSVARVYVFDSNAARRKQATSDGFGVWDRDSSDLRFKLVVGCSGRKSFGVGDYVHLDRHAVLVSASSGSVELSRRDFIDLAAASQIDDITIDSRELREDRIHQPLLIEIVDRKVIFLNAGFPINFDGRLNCVPPKYMQPTAMLMVQGAMQAVSASHAGLISVDATFCSKLCKSFLRH